MLFRSSNENDASNNNGKPKKQPRNTGTRFQRIKVDNVTYDDDRMKDMRFESRVCEHFSCTFGLSRISEDVFIKLNPGNRVRTTTTMAQKLAEI